VTLLFLLLVLGVVGLVAAVAAGRITGGLDPAASSLPARGLPPGPVDADDLAAVRFPPALRGYRMDEVDAVLDRLTEELRRRDAELHELRGGAVPPVPAGTPARAGDTAAWAGPPPAWGAAPLATAGDDQDGQRPRDRDGERLLDRDGGPEGGRRGQGGLLASPSPEPER
jgi:DivIVA domain-containing protein